MLFHFLLLEEYFEGPETACFYEDLARRYGVGMVEKAIAAGYVVVQAVKCKPLSKGPLLWLSEEGRRVTGQSG